MVLDTIKVAVKAFAKGKVEFDDVESKANKKFIRLAPSFLTGDVSGGGTLPHTYIDDTMMLQMMARENMEDRPGGWTKTKLFRLDFSRYTPRIYDHLHVWIHGLWDGIDWPRAGM